MKIKEGDIKVRLLKVDVEYDLADKTYDPGCPDVTYHGATENKGGHLTSQVYDKNFPDFYTYAMNFNFYFIIDDVYHRACKYFRGSL